MMEASSTRLVGETAALPEVYRLRERQRLANCLPSGLTPEQMGIREPKNPHDVHKVHTHRRGGCSYRVRMCKTCTLSSNRLELGTYATLESGLLVYDGYKLLSGNAENLHVLVAGDEAWFRSIEVTKLMRRISHNFSLEEVLDRCRSLDTCNSSDGEPVATVAVRRPRALEQPMPFGEVPGRRHTRKRTGPTIVLVSRSLNRSNEANIQVVYQQLSSINSAHLLCLCGGLADVADVGTLLPRVMEARETVIIPSIIEHEPALTVPTATTLTHSVYAVFTRAILAAAREMNPDTDWEIMRLLSQRHSLKRGTSAPFYEHEDANLVQELQLLIEMCESPLRFEDECTTDNGRSLREQIANLFQRTDALAISTFVTNYSQYTEAVYPFEGDTDYFDLDEHALVFEACMFVPAMQTRLTQLLQVLEVLPQLASLAPALYEDIEAQVISTRHRLEMVVISHMFLITFLTCRARDVQEITDFSASILMPCWRHFVAMLGQRCEKASLQNIRPRYLREAMVSYLVQRIWLMDAGSVSHYKQQPQGTQFASERATLDASILGILDERYLSYGHLRCSMSRDTPALWVHLCKELEGISALFQYYAYRSWLNKGGGPVGSILDKQNDDGIIVTVSNVPIIVDDDNDLEIDYYRELCVRYPEVHLEAVLEECLFVVRAMIEELNRNWSVTFLAPSYRAAFLIQAITQHSVQEFVDPSLAQQVVDACGELSTINTQRSKYALWMSRAVGTGEFRYPPKWSSQLSLSRSTSSRSSSSPVSVSQTDLSTDDSIQLPSGHHRESPIDAAVDDNAFDEFFNLVQS